LLEVKNVISAAIVISCLAFAQYANAHNGSDSSSPVCRVVDVKETGSCYKLEPGKCVTITNQSTGKPLDIFYSLSCKFEDDIRQYNTTFGAEIGDEIYVNNKDANFLILASADPKKYHNNLPDRIVDAEDLGVISGANSVITVDDNIYIKRYLSFPYYRTRENGDKGPLVCVSRNYHFARRQQHKECPSDTVIYYIELKE